jgi:phosphotransferase system enzyme I (PtsI)
MSNPKDRVTEPLRGREKERVLHGLGVSPGVAIGPVHLHESGEVSVPEYRIARDGIAAERARLAEAIASAFTQLQELRQVASGLPGSSGEELGYLLEAHQQMLKGSRLVRGVENRVTRHRVNAEAAVQQEIGETVKSFAAMGDTYLAARIEDIRDVGRRLIRHLTKMPHRPFSHLPRNAVILSNELTPADTALLDPSKVAGFATSAGGTASHTAIMARSLGLAAVVGMDGLMKAVQPGQMAIVDGTLGLVILDPNPATLATYRKKRADLLRLRRALNRLRDVPAVTRDGIAVTLHANLELPTEIDSVLASGAVGVGLLRTEFMFMNRDEVPDEDSQYAALKTLVDRLDGRTITIRTLDAGNDKLMSLLGGNVGANPALGLRSIRLLLKYPELLDAQLAAILRVGAHGPVRILLPMVSSPGEIQAVRQALETTRRRLLRHRVRIADPLPPIGIMIEVPGAALAADALAWHADFFAIGTNDLTQYTLAIDRTDEAVAHLYDPLHPAVLRLIQFSAEAAFRARIPVSVCGEIAGDVRFTALLLGLGIRELSMAATRIPKLKQRVLGIDSVAASRRARAIMDQWDGARIAQLLDDFNAVDA